MDFQQVLSSSVTLFAIIDVLGSVPYILVLRKREGEIQPVKATITAGVLMFLFLLFGERLLNLFGISIHAFAIAGGIVILTSAIELIFGVSLYKNEENVKGISSVMPIAFPMLAGAGTFTTITAMKADYEFLNISAAIIINAIIILIVLSSLGFIEKRISNAGLLIMRKSFGIIVLSISIQMIYTHLLHVVN